jgi:hypothetical protein
MNGFAITVTTDANFHTHRVFKVRTVTAMNAARRSNRWRETQEAPCA